MEWKKVKLGEVAEILTGYPFNGSMYSKDGVRVVRGENIGKGEVKWTRDKDKRWENDLPRANKYVLHAKDIVMQMDGNIGRNIAQIQEEQLPLYIAQRVGLIRAKAGFSQDFIYYLLNTHSFREYITAGTTGTSIQHTSLQQIGDFEHSLPSCSEQQRIATILATIDRKIALNRAINRNLRVSRAQGQARGLSYAESRP